MGRSYNVRISRFDRGMQPDFDAADVPRDSRGGHVGFQDGNNLDWNRRYGTLRKARRIAPFTFDNAWTGAYDVISAGRLCYTKVWEDGIRVDRKMELVVLQVRGVHGFNWVELEREIGSSAWTLRDDSGSSFYTDFNVGSSSVWSPFGSTRVGKIRWLEKDGVLRGAAGAYIDQNPSSPRFWTSDSHPVWFGYVNRLPIEDDNPKNVSGYFQNYNFADANYGKCRDGTALLWRGRALPDYKPTMTLVPDPNGNSVWETHDNLGYRTTARILYAIVNEYDEHQVDALRVEPYSGFSSYTTENRHTWTHKFKLVVSGTPTGSLQYQIPERLSAFHIFKSMVDLGKSDPAQGAYYYNKNVDYPPYQSLCRVDIQHGVEGVFSGLGKYYDGENRIVFGIATDENSFPNIDDNFWKDLFVRIAVSSERMEEYPITASRRLEAQGWNMQIFFTPSQNTQLISGQFYSFTINSRWFEQDGNVQIAIIDNGVFGDVAPPWLVPGLSLNRQPTPELNYTLLHEYKGVLYAAVAIRDQMRRENVIYHNNDPMSSYPGADLFWNEIRLNLEEDDGVIGMGSDIDFLYVFTKKKIYKYRITESGVELHESPFHCGLKSDRGLDFQDGIFRFIGEVGGITGQYVFDGTQTPEENSLGWKSVLEGISGFCDLNQVIAVPIRNERKVLFSFPVYYLPGGV